jgi:hypothetical protein
LQRRVRETEQGKKDKLMSQRFQGLCLVNTEGWAHMDVFDDFPPPIRQRLRDSPFNLCAACIAGEGGDELEKLLPAIETMEATVRMLDVIQERRQKHGGE